MLMIRLVLLCFIFTLLIEMKYARWSDILVNNIPAILSERRCEHLYRKLSMRVQLFFENLVGSVIFGKKIESSDRIKIFTEDRFFQNLE